MSRISQKKIDSILAKGKAAQDGKCPQCGAKEWIKVGLPGENGIPGIWDWECECCGHMQDYSPYGNK